MSLKSISCACKLRPEVHGEFVIFSGAVYYTFSRDQNAGQLAYEVANYDPEKPICLCADFNVNPMAWVLAQVHEDDGIKKVYAIDEIFTSDVIEPLRHQHDIKVPDQPTASLLLKFVLVEC